MALEKIVIANPLSEEFRMRLSEQMQEKGLTADSAYTIKGFDTIFLPYRDAEFEICFTHNSMKASNNVRFSDGKITFFLTEYLAFLSNDPMCDPFEMLNSQKLEEGLSRALGLFDQSVLHAIGTRQLPNIPSCVDLKAIAELKLQPFLQSLGFSGSTAPIYDAASKYVFTKGNIELILTTAGRLDDGYIAIKTPNGFFLYDDLLKRLPGETEMTINSVSRWQAEGYYAGDYYRVANLIIRTLPELLQKIIPTTKQTKD